MTPDALRAAIASARLRPRMYAQTAEHLASMLYGMIAGAASDGVDIGPAWGDAYSPANVHAPTDAEVCDAAEATVAALWPQGDARERRAAESGALDLDAITARHREAACEVGDSDAWRSAEDVPALVARVRELEAQVAAAQPVLLLDAIRNGRFGAPLPDLSAAHAAWAAEPDTDLCPQCGALDLDHACPKSAATVAGEAFAAEHPYAAAGIMGSATAREGKG